MWRYLAGIVSLSLTLSQDSTAGDSLHIYTDSTWADDPHTRRSQTGYIVFWRSTPIAWKSRKQANITLSSTEAELNALTDGAQESLWIQSVIRDLWRNACINPSNFFVDNKGLVDKILHFGSNSKTKYIDMKMKWLRDQTASKQIQVNLIVTGEMVADALTKASSRQAIHLLNSKCFARTSH